MLTPLLDIPSAGSPWLLIGALLVGALAFEAERRWLAQRRRRGARRSWLAGALDGVALCAWCIAFVALVRECALALQRSADIRLWGPLIWALGLQAIVIIAFLLLHHWSEALSTAAARASSQPVPADPGVPALQQPASAASQRRRVLPASDVRRTARRMRWTLGVLSTALLACLIALAGSNDSLAFTAPAAHVEPTSRPARPGPAAPADELPTLRVRLPRVDIRRSPGANQPVLRTLPSGTAVQLLPEQLQIHNSTWVKVRVGLIEGWVRRSTLE
jgi:hypothetical protein